jgi:hypothetical protein
VAMLVPQSLAEDPFGGARSPGSPPIGTRHVAHVAVLSCLDDAAPPTCKCSRHGDVAMNHYAQALRCAPPFSTLHSPDIVLAIHS